MSQTEVHKGTAYPLGQTVVEFLESHPQLIEDYYKDQVVSDPREVFYNGLNCGYDKYVEIGNEVYILDNEQLDEYGFATGNRNTDGSFSYFVNFYNGGCSLGEAIEQAIKESK